MKARQWWRSTWRSWLVFATCTAGYWAMDMWHPVQVALVMASGGAVVTIGRATLNSRQPPT